MPLSDLPRGAEGIIARIELDDADGALLRAMGVVEGQSIRVLRAAPFGGPIQIRVGEAAFALARSLARSVLVDVAPRS